MIDNTITDRLIGQNFVKLIIGLDDRLIIDYNACSEIIVDPNITKFPFHTRLRELACLSPGSVYEFRYKFYPPSMFCSLNGLPDLLDFIVPKSERLHEMFKSSGVNMYLTNSPMEKFKIFYEDNYAHEYNGASDQASATIRQTISDAMQDVLDYQPKTVWMDHSGIMAARRSYFGAFIDSQDRYDINLSSPTLPGFAVVGRCTDKVQLYKDLVGFFLSNYEVTQKWMSQFN